MKRLVILSIVILIAILIGCGTKEAKVDKGMENGVEVVLNHKEPYVIPGQPTRLVLEKEIAISTEDDDLAKAGLTDIESFDVDSEGNIYVIQWHVSGNHIYKFDKGGKLLISFARGGQGPGEIEYGGLVKVTSGGDILAKDPSVRKLLVFSREGRFLREVQLPRDLEILALFEDGDYLTWTQERTRDLASYADHVVLCNAQFQEIRGLVTVIRPAWQPGQRTTVGEMAWVCAALGDRIFFGDSRDGYNLRVYTREGQLVRRIRKEYLPVPITQAFKSAYIERIPKSSAVRKDIAFARSWPPYQYIFADEAGHLFVMTREPGTVPGEFLYDIFDADGAFICRTSLGNLTGQYPRDARAVGGRIYSVDTNDDGYKVLDVYKMKWEEGPSKNR